MKQKNGSRLSLRGREAIRGYLFISPFIVGFVVFFLRPLIQSIQFSFSNVKIEEKGFSTTPAGLENYKHMLFTDALFQEQLLATITDASISVLVITVFSLFISLLLNNKFRGRNAYRAIFFLPVIITTGVVYVLIQTSMSGGETQVSSMGAVQNSFMFRTTGVRDVLVLGGLSTEIVEFITSTVDKIFNMVPKSGVQILLFLSGLAKIPISHYEASRMEGANSWTTFWKITFPVLSPILFLNIIYSIIDNFISYGFDGKNGNIVMYAIQTMGFGKALQFGYASAMSWIFFILVMLIIGLMWLLVGRPSSKVME